MNRIVSLLGAVFISVILITGCTDSNSKNEAGPSTISSSDENVNVNVNVSVSASTSSDESEVIELASKYKNVEYGISNYEEELKPESVEKQNELIKPFLTETFYEKQYKNRNIILPLQIASKEKSILKPENQQFKLKEKNENSISLNYTLKLMLLNKQGQETKNINIEGILTFTKVNDTWLIQSDNFNIEDLRKLVYKYK
ncbi:hypothetical protein [Paenibacillus caui]|uniref:hypothetical protein n=1 Tax=Paenibacillus caui TaxID=2873927 RepID=UPI001CA90682|nr:hypothetical protein [Paenibacillus caui]